MRGLLLIALLASGCVYGTFSTREARSPSLTCSDWNAPRELTALDVQVADDALQAGLSTEVTWVRREPGVGAALGRRVSLEGLDLVREAVSREVVWGTRQPTGSPFVRFADGACPEGELVVLTGSGSLHLEHGGGDLVWPDLPVLIEIDVASPERVWVVAQDTLDDGWSDPPPGWAELIAPLLAEDETLTGMLAGLRGRLGPDGSGEVTIEFAAEGPEARYSSWPLHGQWGDHDE